MRPPRPITKLLVANRGEIACRIIRTARRMGLRTVAVHSAADAGAMHVAMADEAVPIGPAEASGSYLSIPAILEACRRTGADAVHPGYGFLSERAAFAEALSDAGITFVGPNPAAIAAMGDKIESKRAAAAAGVSTVPGFPGVIDSAAHAVRVAADIGYPVMLKASAGGGGKGMRVAWDPAAAAEGFERARSEAASAFGDDRIFIEKFIVDPRHIEIQVLGDKHGTVIHLGERECSIQRRNQKVLEEAPSPLLDEVTREKMGAQAVALARAVGYDSAGTVEFVVGQDKSFFFLEMNTRLQVEHPVTELVTGQDIVELMIRVAAGEPLPLAQADVALRGWAVESRIYAEDPANDFVPAVGRVSTFLPPPASDVAGGATVRVDTGIRQGDEVQVYYDPMVAKLITHADDRAGAIAAQSRALDAFVVEGVGNNIPFLAALMAHPRWREARLSTRFIADEFPDGFKPRAPDDASRMVALAAALDVAAEARERARCGASAAIVRERVVRGGGTDRRVRVRLAADGGARVEAAEGPAYAIVTTSVAGSPVWIGTVDGAPTVARVAYARNGRMTLDHEGRSLSLRVFAPTVATLADRMPEPAATDTLDELRSAMPGILRAVLVKDGAVVRRGDPVAVVEAMKMENTLRAERDATVSAIHVEAGDSVAVDDLLVSFILGPMVPSGED